MKLYKSVWLLFYLVFELECHMLFKNIHEHVKPNTSEIIQTQAANDVIKRLIPEKAHLFNITVDFKLSSNSFRIKKSKSSDIVSIRASSGVSATKGFYYYLKNYCGAHISWEGNQIKLPDKLPSIKKVHVKSPSRFIYYQNVCTWSYSFTWWKWADWQRHIDWMALSGITLSLAPFQEDIWAELYAELGLTTLEIQQHLSGPGFVAWQRMGNIRGWGGPITNNYMKFSSKLQTKMIKSLRNLGIAVALPAFPGHIPVAMQRIYPNATFTSVQRWNGFADEYCCPLFVDPTDPLFTEIGERFLRKVINKYGTDHIYFSDPFNEVQPRVAEQTYLADASAGIFKAMKNVDQEAVWLLQGWMFVQNPFWKDDLLEAFLTAVPKGRMLVLDLQSEQYPQYERTHSFYGQPYIWCMLHNFGGTLGMHGSADIVFNRMRDARNMINGTMVGMGITPEGINQNYVMYEFALEMGWSMNTDSVSDWFVNYAEVRYGKSPNTAIIAWLRLLNSVYSFKGLNRIGGRYTISRRPSLKITPWIWYNMTLVEDAWMYMLDSSTYLNSSQLFLHDLVDITRQNLQLKGDQLYLASLTAFQNKQTDHFEVYANLFLDLLNDLERILASNKDFLLGNWLESAKQLGKTELEKQVYEYNARNQITLWGPNGEIVDYANKQWSGIVIDYIVPRWKIYFNELESALLNNQTINNTKLREKIFKWAELPFGIDRKVYPTEAKGDSIAISEELFNKWTTLDLPDIPITNGSFRTRRRSHPHHKHHTSRIIQA